jgi:hypothetical protein
MCTDSTGIQAREFLDIGPELFCSQGTIQAHSDGFSVFNRIKKSLAGLPG